MAFRKSKKKGILFPVIVIFGILAIGTLLLIFTPAIFGSMSSSSEISKYQGNSQAGNDTSDIAGGMDSLVTALYSIPARFGLVILVLVGVVVVIIVVYRINLSQKGHKA